MWLFFEGRKQHMLLAFLAILLVMITAVGIFKVAVGQSSSAVAENYNPKTRVMADFIFMTNALRRQYGLKELTADPKLEKSALAKLESMANDGYWGHYGPNNLSFSKFIWQEDTESTKAGENLARCFDTHEEAFKALVNSPTHFRVLTTADFTDLGVASSTNSQGCESIVMHFSN